MKKAMTGYVAGLTVLVVGGMIWLIAGHAPAPAVAVNEPATPILSAATQPVPGDSTDAALPAVPSVPAITSAPSAAEVDVAALLQQPDINPDYPTFQARVTEVSVRRNNQHFDPQALWHAAQQPEAWQPLESPSQSFGLSPEEMQDGREFIRIDPLKIESLVPGDELEIPIAQLNTTLVAHIEDVHSEDNGRNVTWTGQLEGLDVPNHITLTRGDSLIMGGISTPDGVYELQAHGDEGWIASGATLFKGQDQQIVVPPELIENPPAEVVHLEPETFGDHTGHAHPQP